MADAEATSTMGDGEAWPSRERWIDVAWIIFAAVNLAAMAVFASWETVPFHFIWVSLTLLYGFRVWPARPTAITLGCVILGTGSMIILDVLHGAQPIDEITEVPLMAAMFLAMVWHARRRLAVTEQMEQVSEANLKLLERERRFVQDASHELRTPITVALGHVELIERTASDPAVREDARVAMDELLRLRSLAERLLALASLDETDPLQLALTDLDGIVADALRRWAPAPRTWVQGELDGGTARVDRDRLALALDALIDNAVKHTVVGERIEIASRRNNGTVRLTVSDSGAGVDPERAAVLFDRFARADSGRSRDAGGVGLGLAIVKAIAEAHGGTVSVHSELGRGTTFEVALPVAGPDAAGPRPDGAVRG
jgi:signal transduction histidine kinase